MMTKKELEEAVKIGANLRGAYLSGANLSGAYLREANLSEADLREANLSGAYLREANLSEADLREANLSGAYLREANLSGADLREANLSEADLPNFKILPEEGEFVCYKKISTGVCKLYVPGDALRVTSLVGRKCRVSKAKVIEGNGTSLRDKNFPYMLDQIVVPDSFDDDIRVECSHGIHVFITRKEAEEYNG